MTQNADKSVENESLARERKREEAVPSDLQGCCVIRNEDYAQGLGMFAASLKCLLKCSELGEAAAFMISRTEMFIQHRLM